RRLISHIRLLLCVDAAGVEVYSVDTGAAAPQSAACSVCQARVAYLTRLGNSRTPAKTASLPSPSPEAPVSPVGMVWRRWNSDSTSSSGLPITGDVIIAAEAFDIAQHLAGNEAC